MNKRQPIDLNVDLGEGGSHDAALMCHATSVNIACGGHAGGGALMRDSIRLAAASGLQIGAHPGYDDPESFGRRPLQLEPGVTRDMVIRQLCAFAQCCAETSVLVHHVKPHGALYNQADEDSRIAGEILDALQTVTPKALLYAPPGGRLAAAAAIAGVPVCAEGFVDRRYTGQGKLVPRGSPRAVISEPAEACTQALEIAIHQRVQTEMGSWLPLPARTLCFHGDGQNALPLLAAVRKSLEEMGIRIAAPP